MPPSETKVQVQRAARGLERALNSGDTAAVRSQLSPEFAERDTELGPLLEAASSAELIGTVATRTLLRLDTGEVVELLWRDYDGSWLIFDCRVFTLLPDVS